MILYSLATQLIKTAVLIFYMRLTPSRKFKLTCKIVLVLITLATLGTLPPMIFTCNPIKTMWDPQLFFRIALTRMGFPHSTIDLFLAFAGVEDVTMRPKCLDFLLLWKACAAINMTFDFVLLILPLPVIYNSGIPWKQKLHVILLFLLGIIVCMASVFRLAVLIEAEESFLDASWIGAKVEAWTVTEVNLGLIVACLPNVRRLLSHYCPRYFNILPKAQGFTGYEDEDNTANGGSSYPVQLDSLQTNGSNGESKNHLVGIEEGDFTGYNQTRRLSGLSGEFDSDDNADSHTGVPEIIETTDNGERMTVVKPQAAAVSITRPEELELERRIRRLRSSENDLQHHRMSGDPEPPMPG
ncbi:hypothetical protein BJ508DRAFT_3852 [Ascobolus immersus RN42]|uniref:Rhodopsin domain-containing protein n=1 Tax=Ascobolus immersus RN42 TaxID=1160509 RepID=A0A3N4IVF1_ASCIM|nr:hypothetical protein BJ508DRAFT_3852 [Ascobolus immersus RN42]